MIFRRVFCGMAQLLLLSTWSVLVSPPPATAPLELRARGALAPADEKGRRAPWAPTGRMATGSAAWFPRGGDARVEGTRVRGSGADPQARPGDPREGTMLHFLLPSD